MISDDELISEVVLGGIPNGPVDHIAAVAAIRRAGAPVLTGWNRLIDRQAFVDSVIEHGGIAAFEQIAKAVAQASKKAGVPLSRTAEAHL